MALASDHSGIANNILSQVHPFLGVDGFGACLCGPHLPLGIVRLGPDTTPPHTTTGYSSDHPIVRFSHTHVSGTGGYGRYGNIGIVPFVGSLETSPTAYGRRDERASPGYYTVTLEPSNIQVELTATNRVGIHKYTFPEGVQASVYLDLGAVIQTEDFGAAVGDQVGRSIGGWIESVSSTEWMGRADLRGGWGHDHPYTVFFYAQFDQPSLAHHIKGEHVAASNQAADGANCGFTASFGAIRELNLHVGISFVSVAKARQSVLREANNRDFTSIRRESETVWHNALSRIRIEGGSADEKTLFYTSFYRLLTMPTDLGINDENPFWHSDKRQFWDFYCLWDSVRNVNALITLFDPQLEVDLLNSLLDIAEHTGWLPDAWIAGHHAQAQGGSSADILFCEAAAKGLLGIDFQRALTLMRQNAEIESADPSRQGRYLKDYNSLGFVSTQVTTSCVSRHIEYAYQDWCASQLAKQLGQEDVANLCRLRSQRLWNLWHDELKCFAPRDPKGYWAVPFDPERHIDERWRDPHFYEGTARQWVWNAQQDFQGLIGRMGGDTAFTSNLDAFFDDGQYHHKETMMHVPFLYHYACQPHLSSVRVHRIAKAYYRTTRDGLSDNEDMGCQSAWFMWCAMGLYPVMGQDLYLITAPLLEKVTVQLGTSERTLTIETSTDDGERQYVVSATLNGQPLERAWLRHGEIANGATLRLQLAGRLTDWGTKIAPHS
jgi:predicted alpha-1,2-mannosidase